MLPLSPQPFPFACKFQGTGVTQEGNRDPWSLPLQQESL